MSQAIEDVEVELTVVLGQNLMPVRQLLKLGRGAVIELKEQVDAPVKIYANGELIARGEIIVTGENIGITIVDSVKSYQELGI
ncbi:MAG: flagellar motor switch protein FliN [Proteobacteria bacterium]|jgi:flagellar motor switch protein FliN|nr:flagellar motor switch protein FliN [Pseudomonadota bacterium]